LVVGLLAGLAVLLKNLFGPLLPLVALACAWRAAPGRRMWAGVAATVAMVATVLPWSLAVQREVPGAGGASARFNLLVALREDGRQSFGDRNVALETLHASRRGGRGWEARLRWIDQELEAELATTDLAAETLDRLAQHPFRVFEWRSFVVEQLPGGALNRAEGGGFRSTPPWARAVIEGWSLVHTAALLVLAAIGLVARPWRRSEVGVGLAIVGGWQVLALLLVHAISRYRVQLEPVLLLLAVGGVVAVWEGTAIGSWRRGSAVGVAAVLLVWAFAGGALDRLGG
jgi:4-amino-4-deoxy-L-arabinose transferase-like glycosyltransferase